MEKFELSNKVIKANMLFLEEVEALDYSKLSPQEKDFVFSQYKRTIGKLYITIQKHGEHS